MFYTNYIYERLVKEIHELIHEEIIFTDEHGMILASTDPQRIHSYHEGSKLALAKGKKMIMTKELAISLSGVQEGVVLPIVIHGRPFGVLGVTGESEKIDAFATIVQKVAELFIQDSIRQRDEEQQTRDLEFFVFDWLNQTEAYDTLHERASFFNIQLGDCQRVILCKFQADTNLSSREIKDVQRHWDGAAIFVRWGQGRLLILEKDISITVMLDRLRQFRHYLNDTLGMEALFGVGQKTTPETLALSYEQARRALAGATMERPVIFEENMRLEMLLQDIDKQLKTSFIERTIAPLQNEQFLLDTLGAWFDHKMSANETANNLHIHKNTMHYRLKRIEELTNLQLERTEHLVNLYLGYLFLREIDSPLDKGTNNE